MAIEAIDYSNSAKILAVKQSENSAQRTKSSATEPAETTEESKPQLRTIDLRKISPREINDLIKAGVSSLLEIVPRPAKLELGTVRDEATMNQPIDYLGQIEGLLEYERRTGGQQVQFLENLLGRLNKVQGTPFPGVDITA